MKNIYRFLCITVLVLGTISCSDEKVLDLEPAGSIGENMAFTTPSLIRASVNGMFEAAAIGKYTGSGRGYVWGAAYIQQNDCRGEDVVNVASFYQVTYQSTYDATTANNVYYWVDGYALINKANLVIEGVTEAVANEIIDKETGDNYIAQAKFLRAITHFEFLIQFARPYNYTADAGHPGVPYREIGINTMEKAEMVQQQGRHTVAEVYEKVLADLDFVEENATEQLLYMATKEAAIAFKTRVYLHKREWDKVIEEGQKLEGVYKLTDTPSGVFDNNDANTESIFSVNHGKTNNPGVNGALASQYKRRELVAISPIIWNDPMWLADDKRRDESLVFTSEGTKFTNKYRDVSTYTDKTPIIRYAEVLLNMAEAHARTNDLETALQELNKVRDRSLNDPVSQSYTLADLGSTKQMVEAIVMERRIEFLMEGKRWADIHRLQEDNLAPIDGIPAKVSDGAPEEEEYKAAQGYDGNRPINKIEYLDDRFIWPIPVLETSVNPVLAKQQNPGY